jgi:hypothetical protein
MMNESKNKPAQRKLREEVVGGGKRQRDEKVLGFKS